MTRITLTFTLAIAMVGLSGCFMLDDHSQPMSPSHGDALSHNAAVMIVDPAPANATAGAPDFNGKRATIAGQNYETGEVEEVDAISTQEDIGQ